MKRLIINFFISMITVGFLTSCNESRKRATEKLSELNEQAQELNTAVDDGLKKINSIDSVVQSGAKQLKDYDSLVNRSVSKIDSIAKEKTEAWEELTTY